MRLLERMAEALYNPTSSSTSPRSGCVEGQSAKTLAAWSSFQATGPALLLGVGFGIVGGGAVAVYGGGLDIIGRSNISTAVNLTLDVGIQSKAGEMEDQDD